MWNCCTHVHLMYLGIHLMYIGYYDGINLIVRCPLNVPYTCRCIWHTLKESNVWGSSSNITGVNDLNLWYFISLMIKEDIPYLVLTYLLQLMVKTCNESAIYHIKILTQHKMAPNMFYKWLNIPCMEMMKTCCSEVNLNLESLSNCNFLNEIFFNIFFYL